MLSASSGVQTILMPPDNARLTIATVDIDELQRWVVSAVIAVLLHATAAILLIRLQKPIASFEGTAAVIVVDLAAFVPTAQEFDPEIAPGPLQHEVESNFEPPKPQEKPLEKTEKPPAADAEAVLPKEPDKTPDIAKETVLPAPQTTAPPAPRPSAAQVASWHGKVAAQIEKHKRYPAAARSQHETGVAPAFIYA